MLRLLAWLLIIYYPIDIDPKSKLALEAREIAIEQQWLEPKNRKNFVYQGGLHLYHYYLLELRNGPLAAELELWQYPDAWDLISLNRQYADYCLAQASLNPAFAEEWTKIAELTLEMQEPLKELHHSQQKYYLLALRRIYLKQFREKIGYNNYYSKTVPFLPLQYFREIK